MNSRASRQDLPKREPDLVQKKNHKSGKRDAEKRGGIKCMVYGWENICQDLAAGNADQN